MKMYLISQDVNVGYDTFDSAVVAARSEAEARYTNPGDFHEFNTEIDAWEFVYSTGERREAEDQTWCHPNRVKVECLGITNRTKAEVICASFNAG